MGDLMLVCALLAIGQGVAAEIVVPYEVETLGKAVLIALPGDTIAVESVYDASKEPTVWLEKDLAIIGRNGRARLPAISVAGAVLTLRDVELAGAYYDADGAQTVSVLQLGGGLVLDDVSFTATGATGLASVYGWIDAQDVVASGFLDAPVFNLYEADARFAGGSFTGNQNNVFVALSSTLRIEGARFEGNSADGADASRVFPYGPYGADVASVSGSLILHRTEHVGSEADAGGAVAVVDGHADISGCSFEDTRAATYGGAIALGRAEPEGGAAPGPGPRFSIADTTFARSSAGLGGALAVSGGFGTISGVRFDDCAAVQTTAYGGAAEERVAGGALMAEASGLELIDVVAAGAAARDAGGAFVLIDTNAALERVEVTGGSAMAGGAIASFGGGLSIRDAAFVGNVAKAYGGALVVAAPAALDISRADFCENDAADGGALALLRGSADVVAVRNARFVQNTGAGAAVAIGWDAAAAEAGPVVIESVTFAGNEVGIGMAAGDLTLRNALIVGGAHGVRVSDAAADVAWTGFWDVGAPLTGAVPGEGILDADPLLGDIACEAPLWLGAGSPARDAGDPLSTDPDGSRADLGAWGGPDSALRDPDGDGAYEDLDCDEADPGVFPGAAEVWYDGVDQDCAGGDDFDQDGDGFGLAEAGGEDCDDLDPARHPDATDIENDRVDQDCDGVDAGEWSWVSSGGGCATGPGAGLGGIVLAGLLARRRR